MGDLCTKAGERETRQKSVSLPPKAEELASLLMSNICSQTRKSKVLLNNHMLGASDFTGSKHWAPFNFSQSTALGFIVLLGCLVNGLPVTGLSTSQVFKF